MSDSILTHEEIKKLEMLCFLDYTKEYPEILVEYLEKMSDDKSWGIRRWAAANPNIPLTTLEKLADDENETVRCACAQNPNTPVASLEKLADDEDGWVRWEIKHNPNTPQYIKDYLISKRFMRYYGSK
jgi:3-methyladenine DNA glycosylase AlkC